MDFIRSLCPGYIFYRHAFDVVSELSLPKRKAKRRVQVRVWLDANISRALDAKLAANDVKKSDFYLHCAQWYLEGRIK